MQLRRAVVLYSLEGNRRKIMEPPKLHMFCIRLYMNQSDSISPTTIPCELEEMLLVLDQLSVVAFTNLKGP